MTAAGVSGKNAVLTAFKAIRGTITGPGGVPISDAGVQVYRGFDDGEGGVDYYWYNESYAKRDGTYAVKVPPGTYKLSFYARGYAEEYYNDKATLATANPVTIGTASDLAGTNAQLAPLKRITGTVTAPGGAPAEDVYVSALRLEDSTWEELDGDTRELRLRVRDSAPLGYLPTQVQRRALQGPRYLEQQDDEVAAADNIVLGAADQTSKNAAMVAGLRISGTVTTPAGTTPEGVQLRPT